MIKMKLGAILVASLIACTSFACVVNVQQEEEPDGLVISASTLLIGAAIVGGLGFAGGFATGWFTHDMMADAPSVDMQPFARWSESNNVTAMYDVATTFTANAHKNYAQIWSMTGDHWVRQAELEAYAQWESGKDYDSNSIMLDSLVYQNHAIMNVNAVAQIDSFFDELSSVVAGWSGKDTYDGQMSIRWDFGSRTMSSESVWDGTLISVADSDKKDAKVYISTIYDDYIAPTENYDAGYLYNLSDSTVRISNGAKAYNLAPGITYLDDMVGFESGIYTFNGVLGGDCIAATVDSVSLSSGLVMVSDTGTEVAIVRDGGILVDGVSCNDVTVTLVPEDIPSGSDYPMPTPVSLEDVMLSYQALLDRLENTAVAANNASHAVWEIYNHANAKNHNVTTLMSSNTYDVTVLSEQMNQVLLLSAMEQLTSYYADNGENFEDLRIGLYSEGMDAIFIRGNIVDRYGNVMYEDVIYTPFFQEKDVTITSGDEHTVEQKVLVAIWNDGQDLVQWKDDGMDADGYETVFFDEGTVLTNTQLATCVENRMDNSDSVTFHVSKVNYVKPGVVDPVTSPDVEDSNGQILKLILSIAGLILFLYGLISGRYGFAVFGVLLLFTGLVFSDQIWDFVDKWVFGR